MTTCQIKSPFQGEHQIDGAYSGDVGLTNVLELHPGSLQADHVAFKDGIVSRRGEFLLLSLPLLDGESYGHLSAASGGGAAL